MKILILSHTRKLSDFKIGSHHYANNLSREHNVVFIGTPLSIVHKLFGKKEKGVSQLSDNVDYRQVTPLLPLPKSRMFKLKKKNYILDKATKKLSCEKFDLVICDTPYFVDLLDELNYELLMYRPTDDYYHMDGNNIISFEKDMVLKSDAIVATSTSVLEGINSRFNSEGKSTPSFVIENGYEMGFFNSGGDIERSGAVYVGALDERFNYEDIRFLAESFPEVRISIYGPVPKPNEKKIFSLMNENKNLIFHGPVKYDDIPELLKKHKVGLLPLSKISQNTGRSPMKLWEYLSSGLNVVYTVLDVNEDNRKIKQLFKYDNESELLQAFEKALKYNEKIDLLYLDKQSWHHKANEIMKIYHEVKGDV